MSKPEADDDIIGSIVASYAARPDVGPDDIVELVAKLRREFGLAAEAPAEPAAAAPAPARAEPIMPIEEAVTRDKVYCLCCGKGFKMLKRHLGAEHGLTEQQYRSLFGLPESMPLVAPSYSRRKADYAKETGFGKYDRSNARNGENAS